MKCNQVQQKLQDSAGARKWSPLVWAHLARCRNCRAQARAMRALQVTVGAVGHFDPPADLLPRILASAASAESAPTTVKGAGKMRRLVLVGVALLLLVIASLVVIPGQMNRADARSILMAAAQAEEEAKSAEAGVARDLAATRKDDANVTRDSQQLCPRTQAAARELEAARARLGRLRSTLVQREVRLATRRAELARARASLAAALRAKAADDGARLGRRAIALRAATARLAAASARVAGERRNLATVRSEVARKKAVFLAKFKRLMSEKAGAASSSSSKGPQPERRLGPAPRSETPLAGKRAGED